MDDQQLLQHVAAAKWRGSNDQGPHQYILQKDYPELHAALRAMVYGPRGYVSEHNGHKYRYANLGGYKYWGWGFVLNRAKLPDEPAGPPATREDLTSLR